MRTVNVSVHYKDGNVFRSQTEVTDGYIPSNIIRVSGSAERQFILTSWDIITNTATYHEAVYVPFNSVEQ